MTEYAIPGERQAAATTGPGTPPGSTVVPWRCPRCDQVVAETIVAPGRQPRSTLAGRFRPTRQPTFDEGGIPFYGPTRRAMRGKSERRALGELRHASLDRAFRERESGQGLPAHDFDDVEVSEFDTLCDNCPRRVRIRLADA